MVGDFFKGKILTGMMYKKISQLLSTIGNLLRIFGMWFGW
jgi:hypothetical protein